VGNNHHSLQLGSYNKFIVVSVVKVLKKFNDSFLKEKNIRLVVV